MPWASRRQQADKVTAPLSFYHLAYEEEFGRVKGHFGPISALAISPLGKSYCSGARSVRSSDRTGPEGQPAADRVPFLRHERRDPGCRAGDEPAADVGRRRRRKSGGRARLEVTRLD